MPAPPVSLAPRSCSRPLEVPLRWQLGRDPSAFHRGKMCWKASCVPDAPVAVEQVDRTGDLRAGNLAPIADRSL